MQTEVLRAFRFTLDPTPAQAVHLAKHAGAARNAFNFAIAAKACAHEKWRWLVAQQVEAGVPEDVARKQVRVPVPTKPTLQKAYQRARGDSRSGNTGGVFPWWHEVSTYAMQSAMIDADTAWKNWLDSRAGRRAGRAVGYPRFKKKGRCRDAFRLHHDVKKPTIRTDGYRRLRLPSLGSIRIHDSAKRLARAVERGDAVVQSVTIARGGTRWYASVLCKVRQEVPDRPTKRQRRAGTVGVDLGVKVLAALSQPLDPADPASVFVTNPRHLNSHVDRLVKAQRALSRTQKGSNRRRKAVRRVGDLHHRVAERRSAALHQVTKLLASRFAVVAVENLNVTGMTRSARGTVEAPGRNVRAKTGLNRSILDVAPAEFRRQLAYKTAWYGAVLAVVDRWAPTSKTCSGCGAVKTKLRLSEREYTCEACGLVLDRDLNAALNIARLADLAAVTVAVAPDRAGDVKSSSSRRPASTIVPVSSADASRPRPPWAGPPRRSDPPVTHT
ncbi:RNA-guided endonuclease InsQ/TnpB family protein [Streptodolium elevatio]